MQKLKRDLTLADLVFYGVGVIFGAGIYVLIGSAAGMAGNTIWLSFMIAATVAAFTGLSYAELASMYPRDAAEYTYVRNAFKSNAIGFVAGWLTFATVVIASAVVSLGFGQYAHSLFAVDATLASVCLIIALSAVNYFGIRTSSRLNILLTSAAIIGLLMIIAIGLPHFGSIDYFQSANGIAGTLGAATLVFFAYLGFDEIVNVSEEAKKARKNIPKAILISVAISTVLYVLVALAAVSVVPWQQLGESSTPLALVAGEVFGPSAQIIISIFALFATASTTLIFTLAGSRMMFGMAEVHAMPKVLSKLGKRKTPYASIVIIGVVSLFFILMGNIHDIALLVDFSAFVIFAMINLSAFALRFRSPETKREFKSPLSIGRAPLLPLLGFAISCYMLTQFTVNIAMIAAAIIIAGYVFYKIMGKN